MFRNYLAAALRNLVRNRLYAAINIAGLAVGFAAAMLIALYVRDEFTYNSYFPGHKQIYLLKSVIGIDPSRPPDRNTTAPGDLAKLLKQDFPFIEDVARFALGSVTIRRGEGNESQNILWADPNMLSLLKFRPIAGDLSNALVQPNSVILTQATARKYFGKDNAVGATLEFNRKDVFTVTAVIEDLPSNVSQPVSIIAAGQSAGSALAQIDAQPQTRNFLTNSMIYMKLADTADAQRLAEGLAEFLSRYKTVPPAGTFALDPVPLDQLHFEPTGGPFGGGDPFSGNRKTIGAVAIIGLLIVFVASINFVNLMTARAARRAVEVGVRKVSGANRKNLIVQFVGEGIVYVALGTAVAVIGAALLLPALNGFLNRRIGLDLLSDLRSGAFLFAIIFAVGGLAGLYPAFVLSRFRPAVVLKAGIFQPQASAIVRQTLVVLQFALLIGLLVMTAVVGRQIQFATTEAQRLDTDEVVTVSRTCGSAGFREAVSVLSGVRKTVCSGGEAVGFSISSRTATGPDGTRISMQSAALDPGFFEFYGLKPMAGRFFSAEMASDVGSQGPGPQIRGPIVLNETAARQLGFASPSAAIGQVVTMSQGAPPSEIIGVAPDYAIDTIHTVIPPIIYYVERQGYTRTLPTIPGSPQSGRTELGVLNIKLDGARIPETLLEIDRLWKQSGQVQPINRSFLNQTIEARYRDITRQGQLFAAFSGVAIFIALLGLFGLSAFTAERRTKEIGIRKAMGASQADILRLLLWQFTKPVLWANLIAWPVAAYVMNCWLQGFAYHVDLEPWVFVAASMLAVVIAAFTVAGHALLVARTQPVTALRYE